MALLKFVWAKCMHLGISLVALTFLNECVDKTATSSIVAPLR